MKIAVFCPNWVGDLVMATPALRGIRRHFPHAEIVAILRPYVAGVLEGLDLVDRLLLAGSPRGAGSPELAGTATESWDFARRLRAERFDLALLLPNSFRSAFLAWIAGARQRVGFDRNGRGWLLTDPVRPPATCAPHPVIDEYLRLAAYLGCRH